MPQIFTIHLLVHLVAVDLLHLSTSTATRWTPSNTVPVRHTHGAMLLPGRQINLTVAGCFFDFVVLEEVPHGFVDARPCYSEGR